MQELEKALGDVKVLHQKVFGRPAPDLGPQSYIPFPVGIDPIEHALHEVRDLKEISEQLAFAPRPVAWTPSADTFAKEDELIIQLEIPGVSREDLKVLVHGGECVVRGERKPPQRLETMRPMAMERPWGPFERRFVLPVGSRVGEIQARVISGLLELQIPLEQSAVSKEHKVVID